MEDDKPLRSVRVTVEPGETPEATTDTIQVFVGHRVHLPLILKKSLSSRDTGRYTRYPCKPVSYQ